MIEPEEGKKRVSDSDWSYAVRLLNGQTVRPLDSQTIRLLNSNNLSSSILTTKLNRVSSLPDKPTTLRHCAERRHPRCTPLRALQTEQTGEVAE